MNGFPEWLQGELDKRGWNQSDLALKIGVSPVYITHLISGQLLPRPDNCREIAYTYTSERHSPKGFFIVSPSRTYSFRISVQIPTGRFNSSLAGVTKFA